MRVFLSAGEASSDRHGAYALRALRALVEKKGQTLEVFGIGGPELQAAGLEPLVDQRELRAMGFTEVLGKIPRVLRILSAVSAEIARRKPDLCVVLDYPDFHLRLAQRAGAGDSAEGPPWVYFIPPKVWVWRAHRLQELQSRFARLLCIFPFEAEWHRARGSRVEYVGNPLLDELPVGLARSQARAELGFAADDRVVLLMPGSRPGEWKRHLAPLWEAAWRSAQSAGAPLQACLALVSEADRRALAPMVEELQARMPLALRVVVGVSGVAMRAADVGLIKSGTSTLEAALLDLPHALVYRVSPLTQVVYRLWARYAGFVGLPNLVAGRAVVPEVLLAEVTAERMTRELARLWEPAVQQEQRAGFAEIRARLQSQGSPSARVAELLWESAGGKP